VWRGVKYPTSEIELKKEEGENPHIQGAEMREVAKSET
jgi:hypothetical protein